MATSEKVCRTCVRSSSSVPFVPLFTDPSLIQKIKVISSVQISQDDNLPTQLCLECFTNIHFTYKFRKLIISTDNALRGIHNEDVAKSRSKCSRVIPNESVELRNDVFKVSGNVINLGETKTELVETTCFDNKENGAKEHCNEILENNIEAKGSEKIKEDLDIIEDTNEAMEISWEAYENNETIKYDYEAMEDTNEAIENHWEGFENNEATKDENKTTKDTSMIIEDNSESLDDSNAAIEDSNSNEPVRNNSSGITYSKGLCDICGKLITQFNLTKHIIGTHLVKPVNCKVCGKTFKNKESMRSHIRIHEIPIKICEYCGKSCIAGERYRKHKKEHTGEEQTKNYICSVCEKPCISKYALKLHFRSHTGERPYPCEYCKKCFSSPYARKTHVRQHTKEKPFVCNYCPMGFPQKVSLKTHVKAKHPEKMAEWK